MIGWCEHHGISKRSLLEDYYPDEIVTIRKMVEMHKARDFLTLLRVVQNPHSDNPQAMVDVLVSMCGPGVSTGAYWTKTKLNESQFAVLRAAMDKAHASKKR